jgi:hypothetical protein
MYAEIAKMSERDQRDTLCLIDPQDVYADVRRGEMSFTMFQLWIEAIENQAIELQHL